MSGRPFPFCRDKLAATRGGHCGDLNRPTSLFRKPECFYDLGHILAPEFDGVRRETNGTDHSVSAAAVSLADLGNVVNARAEPMD